MSDRPCSKCGARLPRSEFHADSARPDGLHSWCKPCRKAAGQAHFASCDKQAHREKTARWREANVERAREMARTTHHRNKEKRNAASKAYRAANREKVRALCRAWSRDNPERAAEINADRRACKLRAIPAWGKSEFDSLVLSEAYRLAKRRTLVTGVVWHVDHRVPLRSPLVCGLHCAANIQVITASQNHSKNNLWWEGMPA